MKAALCGSALMIGLLMTGYSTVHAQNRNTRDMAFDCNGYHCQYEYEEREYAPKRRQNSRRDNTYSENYEQGWERHHGRRYGYGRRHGGCSYGRW